MRKKTFLEELMDISAGFAMSFLIVVGLALATIVFGIALFFAWWWEKIH